MHVSINKSGLHTPNGDQHVLYQNANRGCVAEVSLCSLYICKLYTCSCIVSQKRNTRVVQNLQPGCTATVYFLIQVCTILHIIAKS